MNEVYLLPDYVRYKLRECIKLLLILSPVILPFCQYAAMPLR